MDIMSDFNKMNEWMNELTSDSDMAVAETYRDVTTWIQQLSI